jgi:hypothetical protein
MTKFIKGFIQSVSFNGKISARKLTVLIAFMLLNTGFIYHLYTGNIVDHSYIIVYAVIVLIGLGFMTAQNIVDIFKGNSYDERGQNIYIAGRPNGGVDNPDV